MTTASASILYPQTARPAGGKTPPRPTTCQLEALTASGKIISRPGSQTAFDTTRWLSSNDTETRSLDSQERRPGPQGTRPTHGSNSTSPLNASHSPLPGTACLFASICPHNGSNRHTCRYPFNLHHASGTDQEAGNATLTSVHPCRTSSSSVPIPTLMSGLVCTILSLMLNLSSSVSSRPHEWTLEAPCDSTDPLSWTQITKIKHTKEEQQMNVKIESLGRKEQESGRHKTNLERKCQGLWVFTTWSHDNKDDEIQQTAIWRNCLSSWIAWSNAMKVRVSRFQI